MSETLHETLRGLLCCLGDAIRDAVLLGRKSLDAARLSAVTGHAGGDTIYAVDKISEDAILHWFRANWPPNLPVQIVMEGLEDELCFPEGIEASATDWKCIIDPIDGTRGIMYDERSAWALAGIAPQLGDATMLSHLVAAAMTEIPVTKQWRADQFSAALEGDLVSTARDLRGGGVESNPSTGFPSYGFRAWIFLAGEIFPRGTHTHGPNRGVPLGRTHRLE
jgi:hypothetical protein